VLKADERQPESVLLQSRPGAWRDEALARGTAVGGCSHETIVRRRTYRHGNPRLLAVTPFSVRDLFADRRVIAPSRFGYLGSNTPPDATPADEADALAALLDALDIDQIDVIGDSAGAISALQLALRHSERVKHLAVLVGITPLGKRGSGLPLLRQCRQNRVDHELVELVLLLGVRQMRGAFKPDKLLPRRLQRLEVLR